MQPPDNSPAHWSVWNVIWTAVFGLFAVVTSIIGTLLRRDRSMLIRTLNSKAEREHVDQLALAVAAKADKTELTQKYEENVAKLTEILTYVRGMDEKRDKLLEVMNKMAQDVAVLKYQAGIGGGNR